MLVMVIERISEMWLKLFGESEFWKKKSSQNIVIVLSIVICIAIFVAIVWLLSRVFPI